ncbi:MAG: JDVT-CTERM domain-containing protein [Thiohalomonadales bacterium]
MLGTWKYNKFNNLLFSVFVFLLIFFSSPVFANTQLYTMTNGVAQTITSIASNVSTTVQTNNSIQITVSNVTPGLAWSAEFIAPFDTKLDVTNYEDAGIPAGYPQSVKSATKPGMIILIGTLQCTSLTGRFDVLEAVYDNSGYILQLAIDFVQNCTDNTNNITTISGAIRHNSNLILKTTQPIAIAGADQNVIEANIIDLTSTPVNFNSNKIVLNALNSSAGDSATINQYSWQQISGPVVSLNNSTSTSADFVLPFIKLDGDYLIFELTITNSNNVTAKDQVTIFVTSKSAAQTSFFIESEAGDYINDGKKLFADIDDAIFVINSPSTDTALIQINNGLGWRTDFGIQSGLILEQGSYPNASRLIPNTSATTAVLHVKNSKRACSSVSGNFDVIQINRDLNNEIKNLKIDFLQQCDQNVPALSGFIKYNYIDIKVPVANAGDSQSVTEADQVSLDASRSTTTVTGDVTYQWTQISGTAVTLSDNTLFDPIFIAPKPADGKNETLEFKLLFSNSEKFIAEDTVTINVTAKVVSVPVNPTGNNTTLGGGGGGCSYNPDANFDGSLYLLLLLILLIKIFRAKSTKCKH